MIQLGRGLARLRMARPIRAVYHDDVGIAVVIVVDERAARTECFRQILLPKRAVVVDKANARLLRDIAEVNAIGGLRLYEIRAN